MCHSLKSSTRSPSGANGGDAPEWVLLPCTRGIHARLALSDPDQPASLTNLPAPDLASDGVRIRVRAASVNGFDVFQASGALVAMMPHDLPTVVGRDFAGVVEEVGPDRTDIRVGEEVFGFIPSTPPLKEGTFAEFIVSSQAVLARKPDGVSFETAAAIPLAGATAFDCVAALEISRGAVVLVAGATGGVGSFAVQFAAQRGATVIATARAGADAQLMLVLGATAVVDHAAGDVAQHTRELYPDGLDALTDSVKSADAFESIAALVRDGGAIASTVGAANLEALAARNVRATNVRGTPTTEKLAALALQVANGTLRVEIDRKFPLADAAAALAAFDAGKVGKLVITIG